MQNKHLKYVHWVLCGTFVILKQKCYLKGKYPQASTFTEIHIVCLGFAIKFVSINSCFHFLPEGVLGEFAVIGKSRNIGIK